MVHALRQAHRVLISGGTVADLHPNAASMGPGPRRLPMFFGVPNGHPVGVLEETPQDYADYLAADRTVTRVLRRGLFSLQSTDIFTLRYHFCSVAEMDGYLEGQWSGASYAPALRRRLLALEQAGPQPIVIVEPFRLNVLRKRQAGRER